MLRNTQPMLSNAQQCLRIVNERVKDYSKSCIGKTQEHLLQLAFDAAVADAQFLLPVSPDLGLE